MPDQRSRWAVVGMAMIVLGTIAVYAQMWNHEFINYDDNVYITHNPHIQNGFTWESCRWLLTAHIGGHWDPLTWISVLVDMELYGLENPGGHHMTNLLLHVLTTLLLFQALKMMTDRPLASALVAGLFALHPLHVESVAWATERKDTLSGFFWMATMVAYARYVRQPNRWRYGWVTLAFCASLLSKSLVVTLPCALLLLDVWPLKRVTLPSADLSAWWRENRRCVWEKVPWLMLSGAICVVTVVAQDQVGALVDDTKLSLGVKVKNALVAYIAYLSKTVWPTKLQIYYLHPLNTLPWWQIAGSVLLLLAVSYLAWRWRDRYPFVLVGWLWYLGTMLPMIGLIQVGRQAMADRYTYIPLIGIFIIVAWGLGEAIHSPRAQSAVAAVLLLACGVCTWRQVGHWQNSETIFRHALKADIKNIQARLNLSMALEKRGMELAATGQLDDAYPLFVEALVLDSHSAALHLSYGEALAFGGHLEMAIEHFREAVRLDPDLPRATENLQKAEAALNSRR